MSDFRKKARTFLRDTFSRSSRSVSRTHSHSPAPPPTPPDPPPIPSALAYVNPPKSSSALGTTGSVIYELLATARDGADLCLPLKAALVGVVKIWDICERTSQVKDEYQRANGKLAHLHKIAIAYGKEKGLDEKLQTRLDEISGVLNQLTTFAQEKEDRGLLIRVLESNEDVATIKRLLERVSSLLEVFQFESNVTVELCLKDILQQLAVTEEQRVTAEAARLATEEKRLAKELAKELAKDQEKVMKTIKTVLGDNFVSQAAHDEQPTRAGCMPGTREGILNKLVAWVLTEPTAIFWLAGMAGTGKTSIAVTLSRMLEKEPAVMMGGGFFCSRSAGSVARTDVRRILPTVAGLLAGKSLDFARALAAELEEDPRVGHKPVAEQIGPLLQKPLAALSMTTPLVFVIDALDECDDQLELAQLIKDIAGFKSNVKIKFILTSRPEMHIRGTSIADSQFSSILQLHTISKAEVTSDIRLYIERTLEGCSPDATWYTTNDVDVLLNLSSGLFIFASTVLKYILARGSIEGRINRLTKATTALGMDTTSTTTLDKIYELVIAEASRIDTDELQIVKRVLACILTARMSLSVLALAELMKMKPTTLRGSLELLHSVVYLPIDDAEPGLRTLHASFGDFLFDAHRAPRNIHIEAAHGHHDMAHGCLARMAQSDLCFNISHSGSSYERITGSLKPEWIPLSLIYACIHWAHHIDAASDRPASDAGIATIFRPKLLFWLEAMVVLGKVERSSSLLRVAALATQRSDVKHFLRDATSFIDTSYSAIDKTPAHIYLSALPFAPKSSLIYQDFYSLCTNVISIETIGIDRHGGNLPMMLIGHEASVNSIAYSPDGLLLISGSDDGTVRLWDTRTGQEVISPLCSSEGNVTSVAFSPRGKLVAAATITGSVHLWDFKTNRPPMTPLPGHGEGAACVAFSPDGTLIASSGSDSVIRFWIAETGELLAALKGHTERVPAVAFSPEGNILASASYDGSVRLWDVHTREQMGIAFSHIDSWAISLAFSPDGSALAVGFAAAREIQVWNTDHKSGIISVIKTGEWPYSVAFSPDSQCLVTRDANGMTLWSWRSGQKLSTLLSGCVNAVSYAPDGLHIASASEDRNIYIWKPNISQDTIQTLRVHSGGVNAVALSLDGCTIASASEGGTIGIWDAQSGEPVLSPFIGHHDVVNSVIISADGRLIVSASADCTIRMWDIETGASVGQPLEGHSESVNALAFSPDGEWLTSASSDMSVMFWRMSPGALSTESSQRLQAFNELYSLAYAPDGRLIAAGDSQGDYWVWPITPSNGHVRRLVASKFVIRLHSVAFTPDGNFIVGACDSFISAWDTRVQDSEEVAWKLEGHAGASSVQFSPSGKRMVSGADTGSICIWDMEKKEILHKLYGHGSRVRSMVLTADHVRLVSCSEDGTIRVWNPAEISSPKSSPQRSPFSDLARVRRKDGWLVGPSDELLLWVPKEYIGNLVIEGTTLIAQHKVVLTIPDGGSWDGTSWMKCWRG